MSFIAEYRVLFRRKLPEQETKGAKAGKRDREVARKRESLCKNPPSCFQGGYQGAANPDKSVSHGKKGSTVYKVSVAQLLLQGKIFRLCSPYSP
jgi:hypothetical protein